MRPLLPLLSLAALFLWSGCSTHGLNTDPEIDFEPPKYVQELPSRESEDMSNLGSLFGQGDNPLFSDRKAMRVNDIVTVQITESASSTSSSNKQLAKTNAATLGPASATYAGNNGVGGTIKNAINDVAGLGIGLNSETAFQGSGTNARQENFATTVSARIIKVLENGNYFIAGRRELLIDGEKQVIQLSGVIRPYDIDQNNRISSSYIADAKIMYRTQGELSRAAEQRWGAKALDAIWPF